MAQETENRTLVCSVLFLDIVEYSKQSVSDQMRLKQRFNALLGEALRNVKASERIVLDTGDGAAISFLGNPEDALFVGIALRDAQNPEDPKEPKIRFGINLGPVRTIQDLNKNVNIIGDGINVAQRVMSFSEPGQILTSRSYYEVASCLSDDFQQLFKYEGSRTDKHVREHEVYVVGKTDPGFLDELIKTSQASHKSKLRLQVQSTLSKLHPIRIFVLLPIVVLLILSGGIAVRAERHTVAKEKAETAALETTAAELAAAIAAIKEPAAAPALAAKTKPVKKSASVASNGSATVTVKISPWGEVSVDGGAPTTCTPVCSNVKVKANVQHTITSRIPGTKSSSVEILTLKPGEHKELSYKF